MQYDFSFTEINYGSITIESNVTPTKAEVIDAIMNGNAYIKHTDYEDIKLSGTTPVKSKPRRDISR